MTLSQLFCSVSSSPAPRSSGLCWKMAQLFPVREPLVLPTKTRALEWGTGEGDAVHQILTLFRIRTQLGCTAKRRSWETFLVQHQRNEPEHFSYPFIILKQVKNNKDISIASLDRSIYATLHEVIFRQQCNFKTKKRNIFVWDNSQWFSLLAPGHPVVVTTQTLKDLWLPTREACAVETPDGPVSGAVREAEGSRLVLRLLDCPFNSELIIVVHFLIL